MSQVIRVIALWLLGASTVADTLLAQDPGVESLRGIEEVVVLINLDDEADSGMEVDTIRAFLEMRLQQARIRVDDPPPPGDDPVFQGARRAIVWLDVIVRDIGDPGLLHFYVSLAIKQVACIKDMSRGVVLDETCDLMTTWDSSSLNVSVRGANTHEKVRATLAFHMDQLLNDWLATHPVPESVRWKM